MNKGPGIELSDFQELIYNCYIDPHHKIHDDMVREHMLVYIISGEMVVLYDDNKITFHRGDCFFIERNHLIQTIKQSDSENDQCFNAIFFIFTPYILKKLLKEIIFSANENVISQKQLQAYCIFKIDQHPFLIALFRSLEIYFKSDEKPIMPVVESKLKEAISILLQLKPELYPILSDYSTLPPIDLYDFMNQNYKGELSIDELACKAGRSLTVFKRDFFKIFNTTPNRWIIKMRLKDSQRLMKNKVFKPSEVYMEVGFKSFSHFCTAYKKEFGHSPSEIYYS